MLYGPFEIFKQILKFLAYTKGMAQVYVPKIYKAHIVGFI